MSGNSWVTLATNDSYSLGALVLGCSLKRTGTVHSLTVLVTPGVSSSMRNQLAAVFNVVQEVNILDSKDEKNLALLSRPELGITFTKIHCWRLTQFSKCVFLDADVLVLRNCDELFEREELSAAPDVGWPDCFNSGVFVYRPSIETYNAIINLALSQGSFDGGDQGLLNQYFSDWATKDISRHLPFIYNMCSSATYSYLPAFKQFGQDVKIVHFIGSSKPWLQYLDSETRQVRPTLGSEHLQGLLQLWWDIFCNDIHSKLSPDMVDSRSQASQLENSTTSHIIKEILLNLPPQQSLKISVPSSSEYTQDPSYGYWDPWELYQDISTQSDNTYGGNSYGSQNISSTSSQNYVIDSVDNRGLSSDFTNNNKNCECLNIENVVEHPPPTPSTAVGNTSSSQYQSIHTVSNYDDNSSCPVVESSESRESVASRNHNMNCGLEFCVTRVEHEHTAEQNIHLNELYSDNTHCDTLHVASKLEVTSEHGIHINCDNNDPANFNDNNLLVPSDNHVYISHDTECLTPPATTELTEPDAGLAGALSQLTLGIARSPEQIALEEHLRKQAWEHGNVDYMGRDSFDNIWQKICQTLAEPLPGTEPSSASPV